MSYSCLIVDDCDFIREIYHLNLKNSSMKIVAEAKDGRAALEKIKSFQPDIVLLDLVLPEINGFDILSQTHQLSPKSKVIIVSTMNDSAYKKKAFALGAIAYLDKPFTKNELLNTLTEASLNFEGVQNG